MRGDTMESTNGTVQLEETKLGKDLGVQIDIPKHVERQVNSANKILRLIRRPYEYTDMEVIKKLFTFFRRPHLVFGNVVWSLRLEKDRRLSEGIQSRKMVEKLKLLYQNYLAYEERLKKDGTCQA